MPTGSRIGRALALAAVVLSALAADAPARDALPGRWLAPTPGVAPNGGSDARVAAGPGGAAVAVWSGGIGGLEVIARAAGHSWGSVANLGYAQNPSVAIDRAGDAILATVQESGSDWQVVSYLHTAGSSAWRGRIDVSAPERDVGGPSFAANDSGQAIVAWRAFDGDLPVIRAAVRHVDGTWAQPENLGYAGDFDADPSAAIDAGGDVVVTWSRAKSSGQADVYVESRPIDGRWGPATRLAEDGARSQSAVVMNRRGDALAVWGRLDSAGRVSLVSSLERAGSSTWEPPAAISLSDPANPLYRYDGLSVALDDAGTATIVGGRADGAVEAATKPIASAAWDPPVVVGNGGRGGAWYTHDSWCVDPRIELDDRGDAVVTWGGAALYAARRPSASRAWEQATVVAPGPACFSQALAVDAEGDAVAIWNASEQAVTRLDTAVLDTTPPVLARLALPRITRVGRHARFSIAASDLWSSLSRPPVWRFGDGTSVRGSIVRHAYRRPGRYRVTVTADDRAGNVATSAAVLRVAPASQP